MLLGLMVGGALLEVMGIGLVVPIVALFVEPEATLARPAMQKLYQLSGADSAQRFAVLALGGFLALIVAKNFYLGVLAFLQHRFVFRKQAQVSRRLFDAYVNAPYALHLQRHSADVTRNLLTEVNALFSGVITPLMSLVSEVAVLALLLATLVLAMPGATLAVLGVGALVVGGVYFLLRAALDRFGAERVQFSRQRIQAIGEALGGLKEVKILGRERYFIGGFGGANARYLEAARIFTTLSTLPRMLIEVLAVGLLVGATYLLVGTGADMKGAVPGVMLLCLVALRLIPAGTRILGALTTIRFYLPSLTRLHRDFAELTTARGQAAGPATGRPFNVTFGIRLDSVSFTYEGAHRAALTDVSLEIPPACVCGFVGASGAGKSTLADLLLGVLEPSGGRILAGGEDVRGRLRDWQAMLGYVPQSIHLIDASVRRNVAFGVPDAQIDDRRVWSALRDAQLEEMVAGLPGKLETRVGEFGARLSGGQRQRMGIARALYGDPSVLVLDEATSALDTRTERAIAETLQGMRERRTVIVIAHRLDTIRRCDRLFFLEEGRLLSAGTYDELVQGSPRFAALMGEATL
jgi:ABC-type multidrug transport system fused ATPase/permease subunit